MHIKVHTYNPSAEGEKPGTSPDLTGQPICLKQCTKRSPRHYLRIENGEQLKKNPPPCEALNSTHTNSCIKPPKYTYIFKSKNKNIFKVLLLLP